MMTNMPPCLCSALLMAHATGTLAKGCFGKIYREKYNDKWAAIKRVPISLISRKDLDRECQVYKKSEHPNIVKLLGPVTLVSSKYVIPMEFIEGEDLETTIFHVSKSKIPLTQATKNTIIVGMCEGLLHLHLLDIVHQDLKPDNIMVEHSTNRAVIIDLGLAKFFKNGLNSALDMGNEAYSPPEVLQRGTQRSQRSDVWAMGKIIAELCARLRLVTTSVNPDKIKEYLKDSPYCNAVCRMVQPDPSVRATMPGVISAIRVAGVERPKPGGTANHLAPPANPVTVRNRSPSPMNRFEAANNFLRSPSPASPKDPKKLSPAAHRAHTPRPEVRELRPTPQARATPSPPKNQEKNVQLVTKGGTNLTHDMMKMKLYEEATKDLPSVLPTSGKFVVQKFEEKNGQVEAWEQKEVVIRDGKVVKYKNVKMNVN